MFMPILMIKKVVSVVNYAPLHEDVRGVELWLQTFLTSAPDGGEMSTSRPGPLVWRAPEQVWTLWNIKIATPPQEPTPITQCSSL
jgi:hypothetical protein